MRYDYLILPAFAILGYACGGGSSEETTAEANADGQTGMQERVDEASAADGDWTTLFDGTDLDGWHVYGTDEVNASWTVGADSTLNFVEGGPGGDLVTDEEYDDYELNLDWKISPCGNSGIIYNVTEDDAYRTPWLTGPEMQILDNTCHPDAKIYTHKAGDLYDMIAGDSTVVKPAGEWNSIRLVVTDGQVEHWLNGEKMVEYTNTGDTWEKMIDDSKFRDMEDFGKTTGGSIALQDHGNPVSFRRIRIKEL